MIPLSYDLHIHSCLSPCGDEAMTPANIVGMAALKELDVIAVTDHNSCKNCPAVLELAKEYNIIALPGMEITTSEEVHVLCLFEDLAKAMEFDDYVYSHLIPFPNNEDIFGKQQVVDKDENIIDNIKNLLINATDITFDSLYDLVVQYQGIIIPAHIDKNSNSLLANLGFIPPDSRFKVVEVKDMRKLHSLQQMHSYLSGCNVITNSDAHYLEHINEPLHTLYAKERSVKSVLNALNCPQTI